MPMMDEFSDAQWKEAEEMLESGAYENLTYSLVGVCKTSWMLWKKTGKALAEELSSGRRVTLLPWEKRTVDFAAMVAQAKARGKYEHIKNIKAAGATPDHWQASAWYLERTDPERFGRKDTMKVAAQVAHANLGLTPEEEDSFKKGMAALFPGLFPDAEKPDA